MESLLQQSMLPIECMHVYECVRVNECACVCVLYWEESWVFACTDLVVAWTAVYPTGYSEYLTGFHEPLSTP